MQTSAAPISRKALLQAVVDPSRAVAQIDVQEVTMAAGQRAPRHLHPCPTVGLVTRGVITFQIEGQPAQYLKAGDAFYEPADTPVAKFDNEGDTPATFVVYYVLAPGQKDTVQVLRQ